MTQGLSRPVICVVTRVRGTRDSPERHRLLDRLAAAASAGGSMIQVRERNLDDRRLLEFIGDLQGVLRGSETLLTVNDRIDLALASGADGVHLKSDAPSIGDVRRIVPAGMLIGRSIHSVDEAVGIDAAGGCDYLLFGAVFRSASKPEGHPIAGVESLARVCRAVSLPVIAIGGITVARADDVARAGAAGVAAISLFAEAQDPGATVHSLRAALTRPESDV